MSKDNNFTPDAGQYAKDQIQIENAFRWYAMPGEAGLLMATWPKGGAMDAIPGNRLRPAENPRRWTGPGGYFNECMNGFDAQKREAGTQTETLQLKYGRLNLKQLGFVLSVGVQAASVQVTLDGTVLSADHRMVDDRIMVQLADATTIQKGQLLEVQINV